GGDALHLLTRLIRATGTRRLQILGAYRSTDVPPGHPLSTLLADLAREQQISQLELGPLKRRDAADLASTLLEGLLQASRGEESSALVARVVKRSAGVPFFVVSYARWLQTRAWLQEQQEPVKEIEGDARAGVMDPLGTARERSAEIPWNVRPSIQERVAALPASTQELLGVAAVVGQQASGALLAAGAEQSEAAALTGLEVACQAGLLIEDQKDGRLEGYRFVHDLIRDVLEESLGAGRQTLLHRQVAAALEAHPPTTGRFR